MKTLAIETATAACSVALIENGTVVAADHAVVGRGHAERLLPMIAGLPDGGRCETILVDIGPGSFTGIRVGIAAAKALGFGWGVPVYGYGSLALLAVMDGSRDDTVIAIEGGHGEVFVARYGGEPLIEIDSARSIPFAAAAASIRTTRIVGNAALRIVKAGVRAEAVDISPNAHAVLHLPSALASRPPVPFYGRGADAKPMEIA